MSNAREVLVAELNKAAQKVLAARLVVDEHESQFNIKQQAIFATYASELSEHTKEVEAHEERYALLVEALRLVDEEQVDPLIAKLTATAKPLPSKNHRRYRDQEVNSRPYCWSGHQQRMLNRRGTR